MYGGVGGVESRGSPYPDRWRKAVVRQANNLKVIGSNPVPDLNLSIGLRCTADAFDRRSHRGAQSASTAI
jgi:hypothetical protein